jgi:N-acyl-D-amino-acid deacylase
MHGCSSRTSAAQPVPSRGYNDAMRLRPELTAIGAAIAVLGASPLAQPSTFDVLIHNGRVMDGSGNPWMRADIGIREGRIAALGHLPNARAAKTIDAADQLVTPGFIDVHSHAAEPLANASLHHGKPLLAQGVTTIVGNPDGGGPTDLRAQREALEKGGIGPNVAQLIGHGSVRRAVMGDENRQATRAELDRMRALVREGMTQGAFGLSSGLFYTPGSFANTEEVIALAAVAGESGGLYSSHIRDEGNYSIGVVAAVQEVIRIAEEAHVTGIVSHMKALGPDSWGLARTCITKIDEARARGVSVFADQYPYEASSTSLSAALLPGVVIEREAIQKAVTAASPAAIKERDGFEATIRENLRRRAGAKAVQIAFYRPDPSLQGKTLEEIAASRKLAPERAALEMISRGNASIVSFNMSEDDIREIMTQPYTMASSDGGLTLPGAGQPHPRDYGAFARRLGVYVRERNVVSLEFAIRSMTSLPAAVFGMADRGVIREGAAADIAVFDPARIRDVATYTEPHQLAEGMSYVLVNGVVVIDKGTFTDALPGKVLRKGERVGGAEIRAYAVVNRPAASRLDPSTPRGLQARRTRRRRSRKAALARR